MTHRFLTKALTTSKTKVTFSKIEKDPGLAEETTQGVSTIRTGLNLDKNGITKEVVGHALSAANGSPEATMVQ